MILKSVILLCFFYLSSLSAGWAGEPTEKIQIAIDKGIQIVTDPTLQTEKGKKERIKRLRKVFFPLFDFSEMAKRSLGPYWKRRTPEEQKQFVAVFTKFLEVTYSDKINLYNGQKAVIVNEKIDGDYAEVKAKVIDQRGKQYSVNYRLMMKDEGWKIYDVVIENISAINNYRSQFHRVISNSSYEELIRKIKLNTG